MDPQFLGAKGHCSFHRIRLHLKARLSKSLHLGSPPECQGPLPAAGDTAVDRRQKSHLHEAYSLAGGQRQQTKQWHGLMACEAEPCAVNNHRAGKEGRSEGLVIWTGVPSQDPGAGPE